MKSNIGHLEGASGVAGIIKAIMVLETGVIPPNANFEHLNPDIDADYLRLKVWASTLNVPHVPFWSSSSFLCTAPLGHVEDFVELRYLRLDSGDLIVMLSLMMRTIICVSDILLETIGQRMSLLLLSTWSSVRSLPSYSHFAETCPNKQ